MIHAEGRHKGVRWRDRKLQLRSFLINASVTQVLVWSFVCLQAPSFSFHTHNHAHELRARCLSYEALQALLCVVKYIPQCNISCQRPRPGPSTGCAAPEWGALLIFTFSGLLQTATQQVMFLLLFICIGSFPSIIYSFDMKIFGYFSITTNTESPDFKARSLLFSHFSEQTDVSLPTLCYKKSGSSSKKLKNKKTGFGENFWFCPY